MSERLNEFLSQSSAYTNPLERFTHVVIYRNEVIG